MLQQVRRQRARCFEWHLVLWHCLCDVAARSARRCCASHMLKPRICAPRISCPRHTHECEHTLTRCRSYRSQETAGSLRQWGRRTAIEYHSNELRCAAARSNVRARSFPDADHPSLLGSLTGRGATAASPLSPPSVPSPPRGRRRRHHRRRRHRRRCCAAFATAQPRRCRRLCSQA